LTHFGDSSSSGVTITIRVLLLERAVKSKLGLAMTARVLLRERGRAMTLGSGPLGPSVESDAGPSSEAEIDNSSDPDVVATEAEFMIRCLRSLTTFYPGLRA
jgi:hypothetical protein